MSLSGSSKTPRRRRPEVRYARDLALMLVAPVALLWLCDRQMSVHLATFPPIWVRAGYALAIVWFAAGAALLYVKRLVKPEMLRGYEGLAQEVKRAESDRQTIGERLAEAEQRLKDLARRADDTVRTIETNRERVVGLVQKHEQTETVQAGLEKHLLALEGAAAARQDELKPALATLVQVAAALETAVLCQEPRADAGRGGAEAGPWGDERMSVTVEQILGLPDRLQALAQYRDQQWWQTCSQWASALPLLRLAQGLDGDVTPETVRGAMELVKGDWPRCYSLWTTDWGGAGVEAVLSQDGEGQTREKVDRQDQRAIRELAPVFLALQLRMAEALPELLEGALNSPTAPPAPAPPPTLATELKKLDDLQADLEQADLAQARDLFDTKLLARIDRLAFQPFDERRLTVDERNSDAGRAALDALGKRQRDVRSLLSQQFGFRVIEIPDGTGFRSDDRRMRWAEGYDHPDPAMHGKVKEVRKLGFEIGSDSGEAYVLREAEVVVFVEPRTVAGTWELTAVTPLWSSDRHVMLSVKTRGWPEADGSTTRWSAKLSQGADSIRAVQTEVVLPVDPKEPVATVSATFDLTGLEPGLYDLVLIDASHRESAPRYRAFAIIPRPTATAGSGDGQHPGQSEEVFDLSEADERRRASAEGSDGSSGEPPAQPLRPDAEPETALPAQAGPLAEGGSCAGADGQTSASECLAGGTANKEQSAQEPGPGPREAKPLGEAQAPAEHEPEAAADSEVPGDRSVADAATSDEMRAEQPMADDGEVVPIDPSRVSQGQLYAGKSFAVLVPASLDQVRAAWLEAPDGQHVPLRVGAVQKGELKLTGDMPPENSGQVASATEVWFGVVLVDADGRRAVAEHAVQYKPVVIARDKDE